MSAVHLKNLRQVDQVLTHLALGYKQGDFVGERIMPVVFTEKEGVQVPVFGKGSFVEYDTERAVGAASNVITLDRPNKMSVVLEEHDLAAGVDYREQAESMYDEKAKATRRVTRGIQLRQELEIAALLQAKSAYAAGHTEDLASKRWSAADADPVQAVHDAKEVVRAACGVKPTVMVLGPTVAHKLSYHPALLAMLSSNDRKLALSTDLLKLLFDVDDIIIGAAVSTPDGKKPTKDIWGNFASLIVRPSAGGNDEGEPSFGYTFRRRGMPYVDRYDGVGGKVEYVRYTDIRKAAVIGGACGYLFENVI